MQSGENERHFYGIAVTRQLIAIPEQDEAVKTSW